MSRKRKENEFFDINKLPKQGGILLFGVSMSNISTSQTAKKCFSYAKSFFPKILKPLVGLNMVYADNLYLYSTQKSSVLKKKHQALINGHRHEFQKILDKNPVWIQKSISFTTWNQFILESREFTDYLGRLYKKYQQDKKFKKYVQEDIKRSKRRVTKDNVLFILEEILAMYLAVKGKIRLSNEYVDDKHSWILNCYPGKPLKSEIYFFQKNFFRLYNKKNKYENCFYDLKEKKLYDFDRLNLETWEG